MVAGKLSSKIDDEFFGINSFDHSKIIKENSVSSGSSNSYSDNPSEQVKYQLKIDLKKVHDRNFSYSIILKLFILDSNS